MMQLLPGNFGGGSPDIPPPPPPPPQAEDPEVIEVRRRQRQAELRRKGRASMILTGNQEGLGAPTLDQPRAGAQVLG